MIEKLEISLTQFVDFVNKTGNAKLALVKSIKNRDEYETYKDFYKSLREGIVDLHKKDLGTESLGKILESLRDEKKKKHYPELITGYKKFLGRKRLEWFIPPRRDWKVGNLTIRINPELGLEEKRKNRTSTFYVIKLYFKEEPLKRAQANQILTLMEMQLRGKVEPEIKFAILDIRNNKFHVKENNDLSELPLLKGEASSLSTIWNNL
jgi:hypothetical protein